MKNSEIRDCLGVLVRKEKRIGKELVELLALALESRAWIEFCYSSLFDCMQLPQRNQRVWSSAQVEGRRKRLEASALFETRALA